MRGLAVIIAHPARALIERLLEDGAAGPKALGLTRQREVLINTYWLGMNQQEVAHTTVLCKARVSQVHKRALARVERTLKINFRLGVPAEL